jgi:hypothetical protein
MIKYTLRGFTQSETHQIDQILSDPRGWAGLGYSFINADVDVGVDVIVFKKSKREMDKRFPRPEMRGMSVAVLHTTPMEIWINGHNWNNIPLEFTGSLNEYRAYVVQHEMGHILGYSHQTPTDPKGKCPVMYQQTRGTRGICIHNPWKLDG